MFLGLLMGTLGSLSGARAEASIAVITPARRDPVLEEAYRRVRAEFTSAGYYVVRVDCVVGLVEPCAKGSRQPDRPIDLAVLLHWQDPEYTVEARARSNRGSSSLMERSSSVSVEKASAVTLAIDAVELAHSLLLDRSFQPVEKVGEVANAPPPTSAAPSASPEPWGQSLGLGVAGFHSGVGLDVGGTLAYGLTLGKVAARLAIAASVVGASVVRESGSATVRQHVALAELGFAVVRTDAWRLEFNAAAGGAYVLANGTVEDVSVANLTSDSWALAFGGGSRVTWKAGPVEPLLQAQVLAYAPSSEVLIGPRSAGHLGAPTLLVAVGMQHSW